VFLGLAQSPEVLDDVSRLATVAHDRIIESQRGAIVHEFRARAHAPERRVRSLFAVPLTTILDNAVAGSHVMQQEIAEGVENLAP